MILDHANALRSAEIELATLEQELASLRAQLIQVSGILQVQPSIELLNQAKKGCEEAIAIAEREIERLTKEYDDAVRAQGAPQS
jgi:hypothetical protein